MAKNIKKRSASHIYFGVNKLTGELKHISEVPSGQKCNCICAACLQPFEARKGTRRRHHFAHVSNYECMYASEVAIYKAIAEALKQSGFLTLPPVMLRFPAWHDPELWFKVLNIAGEKLNAQEGRNAVYHGPFVSDARRLFSKSNCPATKNDWDKLMKGSPIRQDYLETVLKWKAAEEGKSIEQYMSAHAQDEDAGFLFEYYERVMNWVYSVFPKNYYRREMQGVDWGLLYHKFHQQYYDAKEMEERVAKLMANDEVKNKKGIYTFVFDGDESSLNLRQFSASEKRVLYERCGGFCKRCGPKIHYKIEEMEADHIKPWSDGGKTELDNGQMLCKHHNRVKGNK